MKGATVWFHEAQSCKVLTLGSGSVKVGNNIAEDCTLKSRKEEKQSDVSSTFRRRNIIETKDVTTVIR